ncbi:hypothetical protein FJT64_020656 [Amphibalanus amphitrite]|uniref:Uncharacterized protein n=1 Tax=Amphibalanus amphitrite TaxID=1232801 RepID=A0A6A4WW69_AMPAM|nr:hypothetical protein FJT64_020656 [Amphibalanus amphitrite]
MGNTSSSGAASPQPRSPTFRPRVTLPPDYEYMKKLVPELKMHRPVNQRPVVSVDRRNPPCRRCDSHRSGRADGGASKVRQTQNASFASSPSISIILAY